MATIATKSTRKVAILSPREFFMRPFDFGTDWTEVRIGMFMSLVTSTDGQPVSENVAIAAGPTGYPARIAFGLKSATNDLPGTAGTEFLGAMSRNTNSVFSQGNQFGPTSKIQDGSGSSALCAVGLHGATEVFNAPTTNTAMEFGYVTNDATTYAQFYGLKFTIAFRGLATQTVQIAASTTSLYGAPYSATTLKQAVENATYTNMGAALAWNDGAAAYDIPSLFYVRMPFVNNKLRLAGYRAMRFF